MVRIFTIIWFGQLISTIGSGLTGFALGFWIIEYNSIRPHGALTGATPLAFALAHHL